MNAVNWDNGILRKRGKVGKKNRIHHISPPLTGSNLRFKDYDKQVRLSLTYHKNNDSMPMLEIHIGNEILNKLQWELDESIKTSFDEKNNKIIYIRKSNNTSHVCHLYKRETKKGLSFALKLNFICWFGEKDVKEQGSKMKSYPYKILKDLLVVDMSKENALPTDTPIFFDSSPIHQQIVKIKKANPHWSNSKIADICTKNGFMVYKNKVRRILNSYMHNQGE
jgi:hypothetical protein